MADITITQDVCMDDCDEGVFEQGDCSSGSPTDDDVRIPQYDPDVYDRQVVASVVQEVFRTTPARVLNDELPTIKTVVCNLGEKDDAVDLFLHQVRYMSSQAMKYFHRWDSLKAFIEEYLLLLVVRNLDSTDYPRTAQNILIHLLEQGLITKLQAEIQVCPTIFALLSVEQSAGITAVTFDLMSRMIPLLGREVTERVFLKGFSELCTSNNSFTRTMCATHIGNFCAVVSKEQFENILLPCYITLCQDETSWGVRKSCAEVIMLVSTYCTSEIRRTILSPAFSKLLQDHVSWVQMSAFITLGPFIATFADPPITNTAYNSQGILVFVNKEGQEFLIKCPSESDVEFKCLPRRPIYSDLSNDDMGLRNWEQFEEEKLRARIEADWNFKSKAENSNSDTNASFENVDTTTTTNNHTDEDIKEIVETVKNAVLSYRNVEQEHGVIGDNLKTNLSNGNVISNVKIANFDHLNTNELDLKFTNVNINCDDDVPSTSQYDPLSCEESKNEDCTSTNDQVILNGESEKEDDNLLSYNSYNYWYISPGLALDLSVLNGPLDQGKKEISKLETTLENSLVDVSLNGAYHKEVIEAPHDLGNNFSLNLGTKLETTLENSLVDVSLNGAYHKEVIEAPHDLGNNFSLNLGTKLEATLENSFADVSLNGAYPKEVIEAPLDLETQEVTPTESDQAIVPQILIDHFCLMTDSSFSIDVDNMSYYCAYSLPAVALTLGSKNWPLLKHTIERLASDMRYIVRRTLASCLHELAFILGPDIATEHLTPIFIGFIKDLDEVRIGIVKHLAFFLNIIKPDKRVVCLPRLHEFLKTETEWNWRIRYEFAKQLLMLITLFKPVDSAKYIGALADTLLHDVSAVRQVAICLISELLRYISSKPHIISLFLVKLVERFAHSKKWKNRQTFALLCYKLLASQALPSDQFATEIMPHLLDLSWDPVANVRLVVAKTISQHLILNEYFSDPINEHFDSLGTVIRRLQADKDRDVRQYAEVCDKFDKPVSHPPNLEYGID